MSCIPAPLRTDVIARMSLRGAIGSRRACSAVQVYDGSKAGWKEDDVCEPVNAYGATKLEAEHFLQVAVLLLSRVFSLP